MTEIFFGTNRNGVPAGKPKRFGKHFSTAGLTNLRFGKATVNDKAIEVRSYFEQLKRAGRIQRTDDAKSQFGSNKLFEELRSRMSQEKTDAILFIHGYNVTFREAIETCVKLGRNHQGVNGNKGVDVICFSWPSDGSMFPWIAYSNDRQDAAASGPAFARGLLKMVNFFRNMPPEKACHQKLHLMAHSMGNYVLRHALQEVRRQNGGRIPRIFDQIFLFAPDEDDDAFEHEHKLKLLPRLGRHVNVYFNRGDAAMAISDVTKGNPDRLGDNGPRAPFQVPGKVSQIDCSNVVGGAVEHSYFVDEPKVIKDIGQVMNGVDPKRVTNREYLDDRNRFVIRVESQENVYQGGRPHRLSTARLAIKHSSATIEWNDSTGYFHVSSEAYEHFITEWHKNLAHSALRRVNRHTSQYDQHGGTRHGSTGACN